MPFDTLEIRISLQKLLIGLVLIIVPLSVVGLYLTSEAETSLKQTIGAHFRSIAQTEGTATSQFINDRVLDVAALARNPAVVDATTAQRARKGLDDAAITARVGKIESTWETPQVDPLVKAILSSPTSQVLRHHREVEPRILKIVVADETGATVAATDKPLHYVQPNEVYWRAVYAEGRGGIYVSEIRYDDQTKANYIEVGAPVLEAGTGRFTGAVNALVDVSSLLSRFQREEIGQTARIMLVRDDGAVISAPNMDPSLEVEVGRIRYRARCTWYATGKTGGLRCRQYEGRKPDCRFRRHWPQEGLSQLGLAHPGEPRRTGGPRSVTRPGPLCFPHGGPRVADVDASDGLLLLAPKTAV